MEPLEAGGLGGSGRYLLSRTERLVLTCGPTPWEVADAAWLQKKLGPAVVSTEGQTDWAQLADLFYRARMLLTPNTAAMHLAAACGCPTVALFGPTRETHWRPWRIPSRIVTGDAVTGGGDTDDLALLRTMDSIAVDDVIAACGAILDETATPSRRAKAPKD